MIVSKIVLNILEFVPRILTDGDNNGNLWWKWFVMALTVIISTAIPTIINIVTKRKFDLIFKKQDEDKEKLRLYEESKAEKLREQQKQDMKEAIEEAIEPVKKDLSIIKKGTQAGLRHDLATMADIWLVKGYCPRHVKDDFDNIYTQYHALGKNGVMDQLYLSILALPETEPKPRTTTKKTTRKSTVKADAVLESVE